MASKSFDDPETVTFKPKKLPRKYKRYGSRRGIRREFTPELNEDADYSTLKKESKAMGGGFKKWSKLHGNMGKKEEKEEKK